MRVVIIRHTSVRVPPTLYYGQTDVPLRESFLEEAEVVRRKLGAMIFERVYTSPLSRSVRLASYCGYAEAERDARLLELNFGLWENTTLERIDRAAFSVWMRDQVNNRCPQGESIGQMRDRFSAFIAEKKREGLSSIGLFAHGGILLCADMLMGLEIAGNVYDYLRPYGSVVSYDF